MSTEYSARHLSVLEGLEAVRKRPGMYIGSTDERGLMHCLWEVIDNSVDEALAGHGSSIGVSLHPDGSVEVHDTGRGIPVDIEPRTGLSGVEVVFTKLHAGGKFGSGSYTASGGLHGVGASVVNALSERLDVFVDRDGSTYAMSFHRGEPGTFDDSAGHGPRSPFTPYIDNSELRIVGKAPKGVTGTRVRWWPDPEIFGTSSIVELDTLLSRARQTAFLVPGLSLSVLDDRSETPEQHEFSFAGGIGEFTEFLAPDDALTSVWRLTGDGTFTETVPVLDDAGHMVSTEVERTCHVDIALRWGTGYDTVQKSFVNIIATPKGGTHVTGFEQAIVKVLRAEVEKNSRRLKAGNDKLEKDDILTGLTTVLTVRVAEPQFEGQTKEVLGTPAIRQVVSTVVSKSLEDKFASTKRDDKAQSALVLEKIVAEMKSRISARAHK
ncbi:MAG: DNA topoisomerase IV subunit B, partial [Actinobacteria bacterium]|nr:DNA topoisomerase IV subunit B [Actinomycetota bacterium]